jgi:cyclopropane fatty-acyl-phospholipid synthase-like methyltransferase
MVDLKDLLVLNHRSWAYANERFNTWKGDYAEAIRDGKTMPSRILDLIEPGPSEKILHLMCNDGREAASLTYHCGVQVDGVDFSEQAIDFAQALR